MHTIWTKSAHTSGKNCMLSTIFKDYIIYLPDNLTVFYICLFDINPLRTTCRRSKLVGISVDYTWKRTFQY